MAIQIRRTATLTKECWIAFDEDGVYRIILEDGADIPSKAILVMAAGRRIDVLEEDARRSMAAASLLRGFLSELEAGEVGK